MSVQSQLSADYKLKQQPSASHVLRGFIFPFQACSTIFTIFHDSTSCWAPAWGWHWWIELHMRPECFSFCCSRYPGTQCTISFSSWTWRFQYISSWVFSAAREINTSKRFDQHKVYDKVTTYNVKNIHHLDCITMWESSLMRKAEERACGSDCKFHRRDITCNAMQCRYRWQRASCHVHRHRTNVSSKFFFFFCHEALAKVIGFGSSDSVIS